MKDNEWLAARQYPVELAEAAKKVNTFAGRSTSEQASVAGVDVIRLRTTPGVDDLFPASFAVMSEPAMKAKPDKAAGSQEVDWMGRPVWSSRSAESLPLNLTWAQVKDSRWEFSFVLAKEAHCWGLGERQSGLNLRGRVHTLFNTDDHNHIESTDAMYKSVPFLIVEHHGQCHGLFLDSPARQKWSLDLEMENRGSIQLLSRRGWDMYILGPCRLADLLAAYTTLTGRVGLPPRWAIGHHQSRWSYANEETVIRVASEFRKRQIPCDVVVLDIDYMDDYRVFTYSEDRFPNFAAMVADLGQDGFRVVTIVDPGIKQDKKYFPYADGLKHDYFCRTDGGDLFVGQVWAGDSVLPDFLDKDVRSWWARLHKFYTDCGIAGIWNDMNEPSLFEQQRPLAVDADELPDQSMQLFVHSETSGKVPHFEVRNLYGALMSCATFDGLTSLRPDDRPFVLSRSAYAGLQRYAAIWLGDNKSWWSHLKESIPMILNMGISGMPFCGVDVGGFGEHCTAELLVRWYETGIFYPFFRNHCWLYGRPQEPWAFSGDVTKMIKCLIEWRYKLLPYIQALFYEHLRTGAPLMRPLAWHYPADLEAAEIDDQFMFGEQIMVAPILSRGKTRRSVYLPAGLWYPITGGQPIAGGQTHQVHWPLGSVPAFVKDGAIIPLCDVIQHTREYAHADITFQCFGDRCAGNFFDDDGLSVAYIQGSYNEWLLAVNKGVLTAEPKRVGYQGVARRYKLLWQGQHWPVELTV